jgi:hypothetical protein
MGVVPREHSTGGQQKPLGSFVIGLKALLILAAVFYGLAAYFALFAADRVKQNHEAGGLASTSA